MLHVPTLQFVAKVVAKQLHEKEGAEQQLAALVEALQSLMPSDAEGSAWTSGKDSAVTSL